MKINLAKAILAIKSDAQVSTTDDNVNSIIWHDNNPTGITNQQILSKQAELQAQEDNKIAAKTAAEQSALNKLKALGLNDAEIDAILGK
jgi:hypothetical protein